MITYKQLSLSNIFTNCQNKFDNDKYKFLSILDETINLDEIVPVSLNFNASTGRPRKHLLFSAIQGSVIKVYFLNTNDITPNYFLKTLSRVKRFLRF